MPTPGQVEQHDNGILSLWQGMRRGLPVLLAITLAAGLLTFGTLSLMTPRYTSEARLAIGARSTDLVPESKDGSSGHNEPAQRLDREAVKPNLNALVAPHRLLAIAGELNLGKRSEFGGPEGIAMTDRLMQLVGLSVPPADIADGDNLLAAIRRSLQIAATRESRLIAIRFTSNDPHLAAAFANGLAESYRQSLIDVSGRENRQQVEARIISPARISSQPTFPKKVPYTLLVMVAALILGLAVVITRQIIMAGRAAPVSAVAPSLHTAAPRSAQADGSAIDQTDPRARDTAVRVPTAAADETIAEIADRFLERGKQITGFRTIVVGETHAIDPADEGLALVNELSGAGASVVLIDWNLDGDGFSAAIGLADRPGILELLRGDATFEDVITSIPNSPVHHIGAGSGIDLESGKLDGDGLNLVLDALDETYDHIVLVGRYDTAQALFEAIEGRFDAGITICDAGRQHAALHDSDDTFLGFEVTDIDIVRYRRTRLSAFSARRKQTAAA